MLNRTKIICTLGPKTSDEKQIEALIKAGMNVARLNFSHGSHEEHTLVIERIKKIRKELGLSVAIMLDTKGPEVRLGRLPQGEKKVFKGERMWLTKEPSDRGDAVTLQPGFILNSFKEGAHLLIDDGYISARVVQFLPDKVQIEFDNPGILKSLKSVSIQGVFIDLPFLTEKDISDIHFGLDHEVDFIAASFVCYAEDVIAIRDILKEKKKPWIKIISKIENKRSIENLEEILDVSDGIMVARGDLGIELSIVKVPSLQKKMLKLCRAKGKLSITATQMLESMIYNPLPTRAEVSDVSNAIYDGTGAVMLSGETASGNYPVETVKMMKNIVRETEKNLDIHNFPTLSVNDAKLTVSKSLVALSSSCMDIAVNVEAKVIIIHTVCGGTARVLSCYRSGIPIIAITPDIRLFYTLSMQWGVIPLFVNNEEKVEWKKIACQYAIAEGILSSYDNVLILNRRDSSGETNMLTLEVVSNLLES